MRTLWILHFVMAIFWVINIVQVFYGCVTVLKVIGILIAPLGAVMGMIGVFST
jgi:hypothetical protein